MKKQTATVMSTETGREANVGQNPQDMSTMLGEVYEGPSRQGMEECAVEDY